MPINIYEGNTRKTCLYFKSVGYPGSQVSHITTVVKWFLRVHMPEVVKQKGNGKMKFLFVTNSSLQWKAFEGAAHWNFPSGCLEQSPLVNMQTLLSPNTNHWKFSQNHPSRIHFSLFIYSLQSIETLHHEHTVLEKWHPTEVVPLVFWWW